jgi:hypothetical protein
MALPGRGARPKNTLPLLTSTVKMDAEDPSMRCCFRVVSPSGTYTLQAESEFERAEWIAALQVKGCAAVCGSTHKAGAGSRSCVVMRSVNLIWLTYAPDRG